MKVLVGVLLVLHGLITAAQSRGVFSSASANNPKWLQWWPAPLGKSPVLALARVGDSSATRIPGGSLWLIAGIVLIAAGLGLFGFLIPESSWRSLAAAGAIISLFTLIVYAHPYYGVGFVASAAILIVLLWLKWPSVQTLGS